MLWVFYPLFPLQTIPPTSGNKWNAIWSLSNITVHTRSQRRVLKHVSQILAPPERNIFRGNNSWCMVWKMCWQLIGWTLWLFLYLSWGISLLLRQGFSLRSNNRLLFFPFPVFLNGPISTFQTVPCLCFSQCFPEREKSTTEGSIKKATIPFLQTDMNLILKFKAC